MNYFGLNKELVDNVLTQALWFDPSKPFESMPAFGTFYEHNGKVSFEMEALVGQENIIFDDVMEVGIIPLEELNSERTAIRLLQYENSFQFIFQVADSEEEAHEIMQSVLREQYMKDKGLTNKKRLEQFIKKFFNQNMLLGSH